MSLKRQHSPPHAATARLSQSGHDVWKSSKIEDRASIFVAHFSPTMPPRDLQAKTDLGSASHRMLAWRIPGSQRTLIGKSRTLETGSDDDGESYGGKRVLKVLEEMRVEGSAVVARWYGGIMLGPIRFTHIEDATRDAVRAWQQREESESQKRRKVEDEARQKAKLVVDLTDRDQSIKVLRGLLDDNTSAGTPPVQKPAVPAAPAREIDYGAMPLDRLRQMDKARDGTIAFLLKRIDELEKQQAQAGDGDAGERKLDNVLESGEASQMPAEGSNHPAQPENNPG